MNNSNPFFRVAVLLALGLASPYASASSLRVVCDDDAQAAEVSVNGVFKGECPVDVKVDAGTLQITVVKVIDAQRERRYERSLRIGDGVVQRVEVTLGPMQLNEAGRAQEQVRLAQEKAEAERREQALVRAVLADQQAAADGDVAAMRRLAQRYEAGHGVAQDATQAKGWWAKAAAAGDEVAAFRGSELYETLRKQPAKQTTLAAVLRLLELPHAPVRQVGLVGEDAVRAFVAADPFFAVPVSGRREAVYSLDEEMFPGANYRSHTSRRCMGQGRTAHRSEVVTVPKYDVRVENEIDLALGGLMFLRASSNPGWMKPTSRSQIARLDSVEGQPFPLQPGRRFGLAYLVGAEGQQKRSASCAVAGAPQTMPGQPGFGAMTPVVCLDKLDQPGFSLPAANLFYWDEASACFIHENR